MCPDHGGQRMGMGVETGEGVHPPELPGKEFGFGLNAVESH